MVSLSDHSHAVEILTSNMTYTHPSTFFRGRTGRAVWDAVDYTDAAQR